MGLKRNSKGELAEVTPLRSRKGSVYVKGSNGKRDKQTRERSYL